MKPRRSQKSAVISRRWLSSCFSAPGRHDQISHLRRQEAPQPTHALDFAYLVGDALFELLVCKLSLLSNVVLSRSS